jgi:hypothetical protein
MRILLLLAAVIAASGAGLGQRSGARQKIDPALAQAAETRLASLMRLDTAGYRRYTASEAVVVRANGEVTASQVRAEELTKQEPIVAFNKTDERYQHFGDNVAVHTYLQELKRVSGETTLTRQVQTWMKRDGEWQLIATASIRLK